MFATLAARKQNETYLDAIINAWTAPHQPEEVMALMQAGGVAAGVVENVEDQAEYDPQLKTRNFFWEMDSPGNAKDILDNLPYYRLSIRVRQGPKLGEHNNYVFKDILGMSEAEIAGLVKEQVIG